jgi:alkanesulfonate monooxygenase SsuD/methylene tetrahydromethanopterin reductase-like flavin-dependent oxidoreductase (luciferase family)
MKGTQPAMKVCSAPIRWNPIHEALDAERRGFDGIRIIDHFAVPHPTGEVNAAPHGLVNIGAAAAVTSRLTLTQTVMNVSFRHPAELAQAISTLDRISGGRAELGLGAGWYRPEHDAFGYDFPSPGIRLEKLGEAAEICRQMFQNDGVVSFRGKHYRAEFDVVWPKTPTIPEIMIGGSGPRLLELAGALADRVDLLHTIRDGKPVLGGEHSNHEDRVAAMRETARRAADRAGNTLAFSASIFASLSRDHATVLERRRHLAAAAGSTPEMLADDLLYVVGTQDDLLRAITRLANLGIDRVHISAMPPDAQHTLDLVVELLPSAQAL